MNVIHQNNALLKNRNIKTPSDKFLKGNEGRDCCAKFATALCIIIKSAFLFNFLTRFDYKHLKIINFRIS